MRRRASNSALAVAPAALAILTIAACGTYKIPLRSCPTLPAPSPPKATVSVQYLGVGGVLLRRGDDVVLTAPLYSNPSLLEVGLDHAIRPDVELIDKLLPKEARDARAILVGHSHYDHLLDVPYIALQKAPLANIYGSTTTERLLAGIQHDLAAKTPPTRVIPLETLAGDDTTPGQWVTLGSGLRFMALRSEHSYQATFRIPFLKQPFPIHLWRGGETRALTQPPRSASDWPEGPVFSFVIDFLGEDSRPVFRTYYQDSGTNEPIGYPPEALLADKRVDLAILCVGGDFERLKHHPEGILGRTQPRFVMLIHWEDFFVPQDAYLRVDRVGGGEPAYQENGVVYEIPPASQDKTGRFLRRVRRAIGKNGVVWVPCPTVSRFEVPVR